MLKKLIIAIPIVTLTLVLTPACAEQDKDAETVVAPRKIQARQPRMPKLQPP